MEWLDYLRVPVLGVLALFFGRRCLLLTASMAPPRRTSDDRTRSITVLVAARNEARHLPTVLRAVAQLDYPASLLEVILISDGSSDETAAIMHRWSSPALPTQVVTLPVSRGKAGALAAGLAMAKPAELVVVFDADCVPAPDVLSRLSGAFDDPRTGGATAYPRPGNANTNVVTRYAALERWTHHQVALAGKDRLGLDPPIVGVAFAVRRDALDAAGGFPVGRLAEDTELGLALVAAGWRLRWIGEAVVREDVASTLARFHEQRRRWGRGMMQSASHARSIEDWFVAAGYLDRVALVLAVLLVVAGVVAPWWPLAYLLAPAISVLWAMRREGARPWLPYLWAAVVMLALDVAASVRAAIGQLTGTSVTWGQRE